jgi:drug/metabolite transporter (DMT)-like permease
MPNRGTVKAYAGLAVGVVAISWSAIFVRWTQMPGVASAFYRVFFACVALWPILLFSKTKLARMDRSTFLLGVLGGTFFAGDIGFYNVAVLHTSAGGATFLGNNAPLVVGLLTWATTGKLPSRRFWTALAIGLAGACLIVAGDMRHLGVRSTADILAVIASVCFAFYLLVTERLRESCDTSTILALSTTASAVVLLLFAALARISLVVPNVSSFAALVGLGVVCQLAGYFCLTYALGHLPATVSSVILLAVAPLTALFAFMLFKEHMSQVQLLGGGLVLVGVWIVSGASRDPILATLPEQTAMPMVEIAGDLRDRSTMADTREV